MKTKRKVRKDFDTNREYSVNVEGCTKEEREEVQQGFFDVGIFWGSYGGVYEYLEAKMYTNTWTKGFITTQCMYSMSTDGCNMTAKEFLDLVYEPEQQGHIHAENMALYAEDAKSHAEPWKLWQSKTGDSLWWGCPSYPLWDPESEYRRKPRTHIVHGVEIPDLRIKPKFGDSYWHPDISVSTLALRGYFKEIKSEDYFQGHRVANNLCYEYSEEGRQAAVLHAKAMLGINV